MKRLFPLLGLVLVLACVAATAVHKVTISWDTKEPLDGSVTTAIYEVIGTNYIYVGATAVTTNLSFNVMAGTHVWIARSFLTSQTNLVSEWSNTTGTNVFPLPPTILELRLTNVITGP